jgi:hypothetical protein
MLSWDSEICYVSILSLIFSIIHIYLLLCFLQLHRKMNNLSRFIMHMRVTIHSYLIFNDPKCIIISQRTCDIFISTYMITYKRHSTCMFIIYIDMYIFQYYIYIIYVYMGLYFNSYVYQMIDIHCSLKYQFYCNISSYVG